MSVSDVEEQTFQSATHCHICEEELETDRLRDHCRLARRYIEAKLTTTIIQITDKFSNRVPVVLHNLYAVTTLT